MGRIRSAWPERLHDGGKSAGRVRSLFEGYGYTNAEIGAPLKHRLMALLLLHRASDPVRHICIEGWQDRAGDLFELAELLWPI